MTTSREIHLASRPTGWPTDDDFAVVSVEVPDPNPGEVQVRNTFLSVDPYMRGRMNAGRSYVAPFELDRVMYGGAVGEVVASESADLAVGDVVLHNYGWREWAVGPAAGFQKVDPGALSPSVFLGLLGMPGLTAYVGLFEIASFHEGDAVFVSGAAGAVGSLVGQLAKRSGASLVVGSAGSAEKVSWLTGELGYDRAFCYKDGPVAEQLRLAAPDGIDVYFDNVGGEHLEAAIGSLKTHGRAALCGAIAGYNTPVPGPNNLTLVVGQRLTLRGFIVSDHGAMNQQFRDKVGAWVANGDVMYHETVAEGIEAMPGAFIGMLRGDNVGKMVVRLS